jgi:hypothetical protein
VVKVRNIARFHWTTRRGTSDFHNPAKGLVDHFNDEIPVLAYLIMLIRPAFKSARLDGAEADSIRVLTAPILHRRFR